MRWVTGILAITIATPAAAQHVQITLQDAIQRALLVQPAMVQARGDESNAGVQRLAAIGAFVPTVILNSSAFRQNSASIVNGLPAQAGTYTYNTGLSLNVDLFDGLRRLQRYRNAGATAEAANAGYTNQRFQVTLQTKQAFYNALATEELVRVAESQVRRAQQQLRISVDKLHAGSATRSDSLRSLVDYGNSRIALLQAQANLATAQANLGRQIGIDALVRAVPDSVLPALPDTAGLRQSLIANAPQVQQADAQARSFGAQVGISRAQYWPTFNVSIGNSYSGSVAPWTSTQGYSSGWRVIFTGQWNLFNGFSREKQLTSAVVARDEAEARAADTRRQVSAQLTQQIAALATAFEKISIAETNVAAATEDLRVQNERYRVGAATILDLLTSQSALTTAEQNLVQVRFDYLIARAQVEAVVGRTL